MINGTDVDRFGDRQDILRSLIAVILTVGGSIEISDEILMSVSKHDILHVEQIPQREAHRVWITRQEDVQN